MQKQRIRNQVLTMQEKAERTLAEYQARTRVLAARLSTPDVSAPAADDTAEQDNDVVESWMADPRGGGEPRHAERRSGAPNPAGAAADRIERGETTWDEVLSGRATDRDSVALRTFLQDRLADVRRGQRR